MPRYVGGNTTGVKIRPMDKELLFDGVKLPIDKFIKRYESAGKTDRATAADLAEQILPFIKGDLKDEVEEMPGYLNVDWEALKSQLLNRFGQALPLVKYTKQDLKNLVASTAAAGGVKTLEQFKFFRTKFETITHYLVRMGYSTNLEESRECLLEALSSDLESSVTRELIRDNRMRASKDGGDILPDTQMLIKYIHREVQAVSVLARRKVCRTGEQKAGVLSEQTAPAQAARAPIARQMDELTKSLSAWNVQKPPGFVSASHVPYKPAQYERPPSTLKCHYCFGDGHTPYRCNLFSQDEFEKKVYREGKDYKLPNGTAVQFDRSRPIKAVVERYASMSRPPTTPGILNLPPGTQTKKEEPPAEVTSSFGKLEECEPITRELIRDNRMRASKDGGDILPDTQMLIKYIHREVQAVSVLARRKVCRTGEQKPGVMNEQCNLFSQDEFEKKVYREGKDYKLPNGTAVQFDRSRPIKAVVERYASMSRPPTTPGILNLPPGTQTKKDEPPAEVTSSFGKLEECEPSRVASYEADMAKRLRGGKEIPDTPNAKKTRLEQEEDMDVDEDILAIANKDYDPFPGYKEAQEENQKEKRVHFKEKDKKEKPARKSFLEKALAKEYPEAEDRVVQRMVSEGRMELSYGEIFAISNGVTESFKKKISRKKVLIDPSADKQASRADLESDDDSEEEDGDSPKRSHYACPLGYIKIGINGKEVQALLDNGSMVNVLPKELAVKLGLIVTERTMNLKGIGGHKNEILGIAESVRVRIGNIKRSVHFWISSGDVQPILGKPFLIDVSASMKYVEAGGETLSINDDDGRTYLVPIITPTNQKWETSFPTNTTSTSNVVVAPEDHAFERQMQKSGEYLAYAAKYKSAAKKIKPVNEAMPQNINKPLAFPALSRDPYETPLTPFPPEFVATEKITEERLKVVNFGPKDFLWIEELKLMKHVIVKRQGAFAFAPEERGLLKHSYGEPYIIPVVPHSPWQQKPIPIAQAIKGKFIELRLNRVTIKDAGLPPAPEDLIESFTGRACYGLGDIMGGYDERELSL
ncbi:hypothetical protein PSTG_17078, partial [Puccinia striiformis f. sp. tritici PST-78]